MTYRSFAIPSRTEVVQFDLAEQKFVCRPALAAGAMIKLGKALSKSDDDTDASTAGVLSAILDFLKSALMPGDYERFMTLIDDPEIAVPMDTLVDIVSWLGEVYSGGRPTGGTSLPSVPNTSSGGDSTDGVWPTMPTYSRSPETERSI